MALQPLSFRWPDEFVARIDAVKGDVPRSAWVRRVIQRELDRADSNERAVEAALSGTDAPRQATSESDSGNSSNAVTTETEA